MKVYSLLDAKDFKVVQNLSEKGSFDFIIVGSGAGGGISAYLLAKMGHRVLVLEEGPYIPPSKVSLDEAKAYPQLYQEAAGRKTDDGAITILQGRNVGGGTTVNWTSSFRTPQATLKSWQEDYGLKGFTPKAMEFHFEKVEDLLGVRLWDLAANENNEVLNRGLSQIGKKAQRIPRNVKNCQNLGYCGLGCPTGAKQSSLRALLSQSELITVVADAFVDRFLHKKKRVEGVRVHPRGGSMGALVFRSSYYISAAGAINSPALLMRSQAPDPFHLLGKRTFLHPTVISGGLFDQEIEPYYGAPQTFYSDDYLYESEAGFKLEVPPIHPLLLASVLPFHGELHRECMTSLPHLHAMIALQRDGFHSLSVGGKVKLANNGLPLLEYAFTDFVLAGFRKALMTMGEVQFAAGAREVLPLHRHARKVRNLKDLKALINELPMRPHDLTVVSAHVMGGCPMGEKASESVVNLEGIHHQLENLMVCDGSVFPTSVGTNPMLTIYGVISKIIDDKFGKT